MQERKSKLVNGAKQFQWKVTWNGKEALIWAVTAKGAKSQAMAFFGVRETANMIARRVKVKG